jgi:hypothetical protein
MELIITTAKIHQPDDPSILGRIGIKVNDAHTVVLSILAVIEQRYISKAFWRGLHRHSRRGVKGWIRHQSHINHSPLSPYLPKDLPRQMFGAA